MDGTTIIDARGRHIWISGGLPQFKGKVIGQPVTEHVAEKDHGEMAKAFFTACVEQRAVEFLASTERGGLQKWVCVVEPLSDAKFVVCWRQQGPHIKLTGRERAVLIAMCEDEPQKVTGRKLGISEKTVESFRGILRRKLEMPGNFGLVRWAIRNGLIEA